jgi:hypothetical protein
MEHVSRHKSSCSLAPDSQPSDRPIEDLRVGVEADPDLPLCKVNESTSSWSRSNSKPNYVPRCQIQTSGPSVTRPPDRVSRGVSLKLSGSRVGPLILSNAGKRSHPVLTHTKSQRSPFHYGTTPIELKRDGYIVPSDLPELHHP